MQRPRCTLYVYLALAVDVTCAAGVAAQNLLTMFERAVASFVVNVWCRVSVLTPVTHVARVVSRPGHECVLTLDGERVGHGGQTVGRGKSL